jgi:pimeloyl-ACP methyl ester carboxylesterase
MEPQIRYARTSDGMNLAYFTLGSGVPFVHMPAPLEHVLLHARTWSDAWCRWVSAEMQYVRYDSRGFGLSTRDVTEFSLDTYVRDLETIADTLGLERFVLMAASSLGPPAIRYSVDHPDRVTHLILQDTASRIQDLWSRRVQSMHPMLTAAPDMYFQTLADFTYGRGTPEAEEFASYLAQTCEPHVGRRALDAGYLFDVTAILSQVKARTLVIHGSANITPIQAATALAAGIAGSELAMLSLPTVKDVPARLWQEIRQFLARDGTLPPVVIPMHTLPADSAERVGGGTRTILFTDVVGHTEMMRRLGDDRGREVLREHERITRDLLKQYSGAEVKTMGDGFMASFASITRAMDCAIALQRAFASHEGEPLQVRVGLNAGEPIEEDGDLFGSTVIMASRRRTRRCPFRSGRGPSTARCGQESPRPGRSPETSDRRG